jgi:hypothetical protein
MWNTHAPAIDDEGDEGDPVTPWPVVVLDDSDTEDDCATYQRVSDLMDGDVRDGVGRVTHRPELDRLIQLEGAVRTQLQKEGDVLDILNMMKRDYDCKNVLVQVFRIGLQEGHKERQRMLFQEREWRRRVEELQEKLNAHKGTIVRVTRACDALITEARDKDDECKRLKHRLRRLKEKCKRVLARQERVLNARI